MFRAANEHMSPVNKGSIEIGTFTATYLLVHFKGAIYCHNKLLDITKKIGRFKHICVMSI